MVPVPDTVEYCRIKPDVYCIPLHLLQRLQARYLYAEIQIIFGTVYTVQDLSKYLYYTLHILIALHAVMLKYLYICTW